MGGGSRAPCRTTAALTFALRPAAEPDIAEAMAWYDEQQQQPGLGDGFPTRINVLFARMAERPTGLPTTHNSFDRALLGRFPYTA